MVKVFIITQNEPFYIPKMVKHILASQKGTFAVIGATVLSPTRKNKGFAHWLNERVRIYTIFELLIVGAAFIFAKFINIITGYYSPYSNKNLFRKSQVPLFETLDINSPSFIATIEQLDVDIIVSISCPQLFGVDLLKAARLYCINAHGTLLPRHRGVFGSFWSLHDNDEFAGSTIHTMELKLDAGNILWQKQFPITKTDTQFSIAYKTKKNMALGIVELLLKISNNQPIEVLKSKYKSSYHRAPTKEQAKKFREQGRRIIKIKDTLQMMKHSL